MVEDGITDLNDILKQRLSTLKIEREGSKVALDRITTANSLTKEINSETIEAIGRLIRENITTGPIPFRKTDIRSVVVRFEVDDNALRIIGQRFNFNMPSLAGNSRQIVFRDV